MVALVRRDERKKNRAAQTAEAKSNEVKPASRSGRLEKVLQNRLEPPMDISLSSRETTGGAHEAAEQATGCARLASIERYCCVHVKTSASTQLPSLRGPRNAGSNPQAAGLDMFYTDLRHRG
jgi:hypothetical protein